jgi:hypothetical protein
MIFKAYSRLSANKQNNPHTHSFDQLTREFSAVRIQAFIKFCKDWKLPSTT